MIKIFYAWLLECVHLSKLTWRLRSESVVLYINDSLNPQSGLKLFLMLSLSIIIITVIIMTTTNKNTTTTVATFITCHMPGTVKCFMCAGSFNCHFITIRVTYFYYSQFSDEETQAFRILRWRFNFWLSNSRGQIDISTTLPSLSIGMTVIFLHEIGSWSSKHYTNINQELGMNIGTQLYIR